MPILRIKLPENKGEITHVLAGERITIGRRPENTIQIIDRTVSAHHAELISTNGHYRLHDLGSTNLTCVDGQPITDFHLHESCKVNFGTIECEYSPDTPISTGEKSEVVPTRSELEYLRRENLDLQAKLAAMQKQIDILSSARLMTKDTQQLGIMPDVHRRMVADRDELRNENASLKLGVDHLRADISALVKERDALRMAWETAKQERDAARVQLLGAGIAVQSHTLTQPERSPAPAPASAPASPSPDVVPKAGDTARIGVDHRALASVLSKAPGAVKAMRATIETLQSGGTPEFPDAIMANAVALAEAFEPAKGHAAHRLANAIAALVKDARTKQWKFEPGITRTLQQAVEVMSQMLEPRAFKKAADAPGARVLVLDDDKDLLETITAALKGADFFTTPCRNAKEGIEMMSKESFDVVLLDIRLPDSNGIDVCSKIREIPAHKKTPVVFITVEDSVDKRAQSSLNGGDDFIAKPFNVPELVVKTSTWACKNQFALNA
jgi:CheY-like chemotaxis protein